MSSAARKIAFVTPWFGGGAGGAEVFCAGLARSVAAFGREVEVLTTCCRDPFHDWGSNQLPEGESEIEGGIRLRRFPVRPRNAALYVQRYRVMEADTGMTPEQEEEMLANSINSDALNQFIARHHDEYLFFFLPYLYGTTYFGLREAGRENGFLIPCLHNESFAYLEAIQGMFRRAGGCLFLSEPERDFASAIYDFSQTQTFLLGGGVSRDCQGDAARFRRDFGVDGPFALFAGRKVPGKGADILVRYFDEYLAMSPDEDLKLVMAGPGDIEIPAYLNDLVIPIYAKTPQQLFDAMAACEFLIHPSLYESFSIVLMEAWLNRKPVLVNGECEVTLHHALKSNGGLFFTNFGEFAETVKLLRSDAKMRRALALAGEEYVKANFLWHDTATRFHAFLNALENK